jgi:hypothetical protein
MSPAIFVLFLALGAALIALWLDLRFPGLAPETLRANFVHAAVALVALTVVPVVIEPMFSPGQSLIVQLVGLLGILFAVLVYAFLAFMWLVKPLASGLPGR